MKATVIQVPGGGFVARSDSGHWTTLDWSKSGGGQGGSPTPVEMVLIALGACAAIDVVAILQKARTPTASLRVEMSAERAEAHPRVLTSIHMEFIVSGEGIKEKALERAIRLSEEKYCSVAGMIRDVARIRWSYRIEA